MRQACRVPHSVHSIRMKTANNAPVDNLGRKPTIGYRNGRKIVKAATDETFIATAANIF